MSIDGAAQPENRTPFLGTAAPPLSTIDERATRRAFCARACLSEHQWRQREGLG